MNARQEVEQMTLGLIESSDIPLTKRAIVHAIMAEKSESFSDEFGMQLGFDAVEASVRGCLQKAKLTPKKAADVDEQLLLPGFKHIQRFYLVNRDGESTAVKVQCLTEEERSLKVKELRRMAIGCNAHADELEQFPLGDAAVA